jgi:hypothetical protein
VIIAEVFHDGAGLDWFNRQSVGTNHTSNDLLPAFRSRTDIRNTGHPSFVIDRMATGTRTLRVVIGNWNASVGHWLFGCTWRLCRKDATSGEAENQK